MKQYTQEAMVQATKFCYLFPLAMLSVECCWPATAKDVDAVRGSVMSGTDSGPIRLRRRVADRKARWHVRRWEEAGWRCLPCVNPMTSDEVEARRRREYRRRKRVTAILLKTGDMAEAFKAGGKAKQPGDRGGEGSPGFVRSGKW